MSQRLLAAPLLLLIAGPALAQEAGNKPADRMSQVTFSGLALRSIGPAVTSGRVVGFAVHPRDRSHYFVAAASGGVWKTTNAGTTWTPVFDNEGSYSIGVVVLDPKNPNVVWVGAGENNSQRSVGYGDGVYRSDDGGRSWKNVGLKSSEHIGKILPVIGPRVRDLQQRQPLRSGQDVPRFFCQGANCMRTLPGALGGQPRTGKTFGA